MLLFEVTEIYFEPRTVFLHQANALRHVANKCMSKSPREYSPRLQSAFGFDVKTRPQKSSSMNHVVILSASLHYPRAPVRVGAALR